MNIRMLAVDIDGTLLGKDGILSDKTKASIRRATDAGMEVCLCTGRHHADALAYADELGVSTPVVAGNGAIIVDQNQKVRFSQIIPFPKVQKIEDALILADLQGIFYTGRGVLLHNGSPVEGWYRSRNAQLAGKLRLQQNQLLTRRLRIEDDEVYKISAVSPDSSRLRSMKGTLSSLSLSLTQSADHNIEVMELGVTKAAALEWLLRSLGMSFSNLAAIGDGKNDLEMIRSAGIGIAMGNGDVMLKKVADAVAPPNTEHGLASVIDSLLSGNGVLT